MGGKESAAVGSGEVPGPATAEKGLHRAALAIAAQSLAPLRRNSLREFAYGPRGPPIGME
jgi:hypothetical protein